MLGPRPRLFLALLVACGCGSNAGPAASEPDAAAPGETPDAASADQPASPDLASIADATVIPDARPDVVPDSRPPTPDAAPACTPATCQMLAGHYMGTYRIYTDERLGSSIINQMECVGTSSLELDLAKNPPLQGTLSCTYAGGLTLFDKGQSGTLQGSVMPDGAIIGSLTHAFNNTSRMFTFKGTIQAGKLVTSGTSSWLPHPMSAVAWGIEFSVNASKP